jgi:uncharacterized protein YjiS (DUF1127 family)
MRKENSSLGSNPGRRLKAAALWAIAVARLLARCVSCYTQFQREHNELAQLGCQDLHDIGLTRYDVRFITRRPIWRHCWQSVRSCPNKRCRFSSICTAECRLTRTRFSGPRAITKSDMAIE